MNRLESKQQEREFRQRERKSKWLRRLGVITVVVTLSYFGLSYIIEPVKEQVPSATETPLLDHKMLVKERNTLFKEFDVIIKTEFEEGMYQMEGTNPSPETAVMHFKQAQTDISDWRKRFSKHIVLDKEYSEASRNKYLLLGNDMALTSNAYWILAKQSVHFIEEGQPAPTYFQQALTQSSYTSYAELQEDLNINKENFDLFDASMPKNSF